MRNHVGRFTRTVSAAAGMALAAFWPALAFAQTAAPQPSLKNVPPVWLGLLVMFLLLAVVIGVSLMPSKRSRLD